MYLLTQDGTQIIATEHVERFCIAHMTDCERILASYSRNLEPVTIARYAKSEDVRGIMFELLDMLARGEGWFEMPPSILQGEGARKHDARNKRKGGS